MTEKDGILYYSIPPKVELCNLRTKGLLRTNHWMTCVKPPPHGGKA